MTVQLGSDSDSDSDSDSAKERQAVVAVGDSRSNKTNFGERIKNEGLQQGGAVQGSSVIDVGDGFRQLRRNRPGNKQDGV
jgi:hypothetical protein